MASETLHEIKQVEKMFNTVGFDTLRCDDAVTRCCFNVIAIRPCQFFITKVCQNIDSLSEKNLMEMSIIARFLNALPIIIGKGNRRSLLDDDAIYFRYNGQIVAFNFQTLQNMLIHNILPYKIAKRGNFISKIDGEKLKNCREKSSISRKELSTFLNVSTKTIAEYERGSMNSSIGNVEKLEELFNMEIKVPIDILSYKIPDKKFKEFPHIKPEFGKKSTYFADEIYELFEELGFNQYWTKKSPFDVLLNVPQGQKKDQNISIPMFSSLFASVDEKEVKKVQLLSQLMRILNIHGTIIVDDKVDAKQCKLAGIPAIEHKELKEVRNPKEFKKLVRKKF